MIGLGKDVGDPEGNEPALGESLMQGVRGEELVEDLGEAELDQEAEEQRDVVDAFVSQLQGGFHGGTPTQPGERRGCTAVEGAGGRTRYRTCKHGQRGQNRQEYNCRLSVRLFRERGDVTVRGTESPNAPEPQAVPQFAGSVTGLGRSDPW